MREENFSSLEGGLRRVTKKQHSSPCVHLRRGKTTSPLPVRRQVEGEIVRGEKMVK
jgi:hypothetical protein